MGAFFAFVFVVVVIGVFLFLILDLFLILKDSVKTETKIEKTNEFRIQEFRGFFIPQIKVIITRIQVEKGKVISTNKIEQWGYLNSKFQYKIHKTQFFPEGFSGDWDHYITKDEAIHFETIEACENFIKNYGTPPKYHEVKL